MAITGGGRHTCAILDNGKVRCWGDGGQGQLGYGNTRDIGDNETPASVRPVNLGRGRTAVAISGGYLHTCAILDNGKVRCWGLGASGQLGYGDRKKIGDDETARLGRPGEARRPAKGDRDLGLRPAQLRGAQQPHGALLGHRPLRAAGLRQHAERRRQREPRLGGPGEARPGRKAVAIQAGGRHTFALLDNGRLRSWGLASDGQLGYANTRNIGDNEKPSSAGPVNLGGNVATS